MRLIQFMMAVSRTTYIYIYIYIDIVENNIEPIVTALVSRPPPPHHTHPFVQLGLEGGTVGCGWGLVATWGKGRWPSKGKSVAEKERGVAG